MAEQKVQNKLHVIPPRIDGEIAIFKVTFEKHHGFCPRNLKITENFQGLLKSSGKDAVMYIGVVSAIYLLAVAYICITYFKEVRLIFLSTQRVTFNSQSNFHKGVRKISF